MKISIEHIKPIVREQQKKHERIKGLAKSVFSEILVCQKSNDIVRVRCSESKYRGGLFRNAEISGILM